MAAAGHRALARSPATTLFTWCRLVGKRAHLLLPAALAFSLAPSTTSAQTIRGRLVDDATDQMIPDAMVTLISERGRSVDRALTNSLGIFILDAELGAFQLEAERIGYRTTRSLLFEMPVMDTLDIEFRIDAEAVLIAPLMVTVGLPPGRELFDEHVELGEGFFYTPELIDSIRPEKYVADIFRARDRRTWTRWGWGRREDFSTGPIPGIVSYLGHGCLHFVVDHTPVGAPFWGSSVWGVPPLSDLTPDKLVAVEVYRAPHELPKDFTRELRVRNAWERRALQRINRLECGVVVFWTEDGW